MKNFKRIICLILCTVTLLSSLSLMAACNKDDGEDNASEPQNSDGDGKGTEDATKDASDVGDESEQAKEADTVYKEDLKKYSLIVPNGVNTNLKAMADNLVETLNTSWKTEMTLGVDENTEESEYEILIGNTNRPETATFRNKLKDGQCGYGVVGRKIVILGSEDAYTEKAITIFVNLVVLASRNASVKYMNKNQEKIVDAEDMITVISFNLRCGHSGTMQGSSTKLIKSYMPDLLGVQEADPAWMGALNGRLKKNGYAFVGLGRDGEGNGERTAIFYRADKFEVIKEATFWLTDTPEQVSVIEGSECRRIVTVAVFKRISDGKEFVYANTHLDHSTKEVRIQQMKYLYEHVKNFTDSPYIITGDFNCDKASQTYRLMTEELGYENCSALAPEARNRTQATHTVGSTIDYCFRSSGAEFEPYLYAVCNEKKNGNVLSDHFPLLFIFNLH